MVFSNKTLNPPRCCVFVLYAEHVIKSDGSANNKAIISEILCTPPYLSPLVSNMSSYVLKTQSNTHIYFDTLRWRLCSRSWAIWQRQGHGMCRLRREPLLVVLLNLKSDIVASTQIFSSCRHGSLFLQRCWAALCYSIYCVAVLYAIQIILQSKII